MIHIKISIDDRVLNSFAVWVRDNLRGRLSTSPAVRTAQQHPRDETGRPQDPHAAPAPRFATGQGYRSLVQHPRVPR